MTTGSDFVEAVDLIQESIQQIGDEIQSPLTTDTESGDLIIGYRARNGRYLYNVGSYQGDHFFVIEFPYNIPRDLGNILTEEDATEILDDTDHESTQDITALAAYEILEKMSQENKDAFRYELSQLLSNTDTAFSLDQTESGAVVGFTIKRKIFPYEDHFSLTEFNHSVQTVVNQGHAAVQFVATAFNFEELVLGETSTEAEKEAPRYVQ